MKYSLSSSYHIVEAEGGAVALNKKTGKYLQLNSMAIRVLQSYLHGDDRAEIVRTLTAEYPESAARIDADVVSLEEALLQQRILEAR